MSSDEATQIKGCTEVLERGDRETTKNRAAAHYNRAQAYFRQEDFGKAIADYTKALRYEPEYVKALTGRAMAHFELKRFKAALRDVNKAISTDPEIPDSYEVRFHFHLLHGRFDDAMSDINKAISLKADKPAYYTLRGILNSANYEFDDAVRDYTRAMELGAKGSDAIRLRATANWTLQNLDAALADVKSLLEQVENDPDALGLAGEIYLAQHETDKASATFEKLVAAHPDNALGYWGSGVTHYKLATEFVAMTALFGSLEDAKDSLKVFDKVLEFYNTALAKDPELGRAYLSRGFFFHTQEGDYGKAIADFTRAIDVLEKAEKNPERRGDAFRHFRDRVAAYRRRAYSYGEMGKWQLAVADFETAIGLNGKYGFDPDAADPQQLANALLQVGKAADALTHAKKAIELDPEYTAAWATLGETYKATGNRDEAMRAFTKVVALDPENEDAGKALADLAAMPEEAQDAAPKKVAPSPSGDTISRKMEVSFWNSVKDSGDADMLQAYLDQFPRGEFAATAKDKLRELEKSNEPEQLDPTTKARNDLRFWNSIKDTDDTAQFQAYLDKHPNGEFAVLAKIRLAKLKAKADDRKQRPKAKPKNKKTVKPPPSRDESKVDLSGNWACTSEGKSKYSPYTKCKGVTKIERDGDPHKFKTVSNSTCTNRLGTATTNGTGGMVLKDDIIHSTACTAEGHCGSARYKLISKNKIVSIGLTGVEKTRCERAQAGDAGQSNISERAKTPQLTGRELVIALQTELKRVGCDPGTVDGQWGKKGRRALGLFNEHASLSLPTANPTNLAVGAIKERNQRVCSVVKTPKR